jgi:GNAT superfamily N-acetyltransferase
MHEITAAIRPIQVEDAQAAAALSIELGYPIDVPTVLRRIEQLARHEDHAVLVACVDGAVVGWIDLSVEVHLQSDPVALIGGLVVSESVRNLKIGRQLCAAGEAWARARGVSTMLVRSNVIRERAHAFYLRDGYVRVKTSGVFEKTLSQ